MREINLRKSGKLLIALAAMVFLMSTMMILSVSADILITDSADVGLGDEASISITGANGKEQVTLLVYLGTPDDENILYIDQQEADGGAYTFTFKVNPLKSTGTYTVLVGSESSDTATGGTLTVLDGTTTKTVESIAIKAAPKAQYYVNDQFDKTVGSIEVTYDDATTATVPFSDARVSFEGFNSATAVENQVITVSYTEVGSAVKTTTYTVDILDNVTPEKMVESIAIEDAPKAEYYVNQPFDDAVGSIEVTYDDATTATVPFSDARVSFEGFDSSVAADGQVITVSYAELGSDVKTTTYTVDIVQAPPAEIQSISVVGVKTQYNVGDVFDMTEGNIVATYKQYDNTTYNIDVAFDDDGVDITYDFSTVGEGIVVTVTYDGELTTFTVNVIDPTDPDVAVTGITMTTTNVEVSVSGTTQLDAAVTPSNATNKGIRYESLNKNVATVDANGVVTGVALGTAKIVAITSDGGYIAIAEVAVINPLVITEQGGLRFKVVSNVASDTPIVGAKVTLTRIAPAVNMVAYTDANGYVTFEDIVPSAELNAWIGIVVEADGYAKRIFTASDAGTNLKITSNGLNSFAKVSDIVLVLPKVFGDVDDSGVIDLTDINGVKALEGTVIDYGSN